VAIYREAQFRAGSKGDTQGASSSESNRYEELIVNLILLKTAYQRGNIDRGGPNRNHRGLPESRSQ
jgi:hypothetical protein